MDNFFIRLGNYAYNFLEKKKKFFLRNIFRRMLLIYFYILSLKSRNRFECFIRLGTLNLNLNRMKRAELYYSLAEKTAKSRFEITRVAMCLGNLSFIMRDFQKSIIEYRRALKSSDYSTTIFSNLAFVYYEMGEYKESYRYAKESIRISRMEKGLKHTIDPEDNIRDLIFRLEKLPDVAGSDGCGIV